MTEGSRGDKQREIKAWMTESSNPAGSSKLDILQQTKLAFLLPLGVRMGAKVSFSPQEK